MSRFLFIHVPKTGGGSIRRWFKFNVKPDQGLLPKLNDTHEPYSEFYKHFKQKNQLSVINGLHSFAVVRNPYTRLISWYEWTPTKMNDNIKNGKFVTDSQLLLDAYNKGIDYWFDFMLDTREIFRLSQAEYVKGVDIVLPFEELGDRFKMISRLAKVNKPLQKNVHVGNYKLTFKDLSAQVIRKTENHFAEDFNLFGYNANLDTVPDYFDK